MALNGSQLALTAFIISTIIAVTTAQSSSSCNSAIVSLSPCLNYISGKATSPPSSCCSQLRSLVNSEPQCLCTLLNGGAASGLGISINKTQALALPSACNVQTPSISQCSTSSSPTDSPSSPNSPSGSGSNVVPSVDTSAANGGTAEVSIILVLGLIFMAVFSSVSAMITV